MSKYLEIKKALDEGYIVRNTKQDETIGFIVKRKVGRWSHWCFEPKSDTYFTNGCLKEISEFITKLYRDKK